MTIVIDIRLDEEDCDSDIIVSIPGDYFTWRVYEPIFFTQELSHILDVDKMIVSNSNGLEDICAHLYVSDKTDREIIIKILKTYSIPYIVHRIENNEWTEDE
jgi:hypothetical protein